jgi:hypothetical protein
MQSPKKGKWGGEDVRGSSFWEAVIREAEIEVATCVEVAISGYFSIT